jgi:cytosine/adenosine deaminase-related metal-dependent hydrolase
LSGKNKKENYNKPMTFRAGWVLSDPFTLFENGFITIQDGVITDIGTWPETGGSDYVDYGAGVILPVFVNAHTHLELTALQGRVSWENGFDLWVKCLIQIREDMGHNALKLSADKGIRELIKSGCKVVGEVSTLDLTWESVLQSGLYGVWFKEFLGNSVNKNLTHCKKNVNISKSLAGHAPHTTSPHILHQLKHASGQYNLPFSIHVAESFDEIQFLSTGKGPWADFLIERNIDYSSWGLPVKTPVQYLEKLGILDKNTIVVHVLHAQKKDFEILMDHHVSVCLCPRSNFNLHKKLPDLEKMLQVGIKPCLGTDSLASVESLSMFDEMAYISKAFPWVPPESIIEMATTNGACALGFENRLGSLVPGKYGAFFYMSVNASNRAGLLDAIVNADGDAYY